MSKEAKKGIKNPKSIAMNPEFARSQAAPKEVPGRKDERKTIAVRMSHADWERLRIFAIKERLTIQALALRGFSMQMVEKGLPKLG